MELCGLGDISLVQCNLLEVYFILCSYSTIAAHWMPIAKLVLPHTPPDSIGVFYSACTGAEHSNGNSHANTINNNKNPVSSKGIALFFRMSQSFLRDRDDEPTKRSRR